MNAHRGSDEARRWPAPLRRPPAGGVFLAWLLALAIPLAGCGRAYELKGIPYPPGKAAADFTLMASDGRPFRLSDHRGELVLMFFGYTSCPDICPLTLSEAKKVLEGLGPQADRVRFLFITVDPERDTPQRLAEYTAMFHPAIVGLTGDPAELERVRKAYGIVADREQLSDSAVGYVINHTARMFLVDAAGNLRLSYAHGTPPADIVADLRYLLRTEK
ncbi:MAG: SCO family protein [Caldilineales bacterium]|nr:SCO family protein [Caldilineales bacterium]MDW8317309.1 SCO family protein [Anaerolineae bacterium]